MHDPAKILANMAKTKKMAAAAVKENTIGRHVIELIRRSGEISVGALIGSLESAITNSSSAQGKGAPEHDLPRLTAEEALNHIRVLMQSRAD